MKFTISHLYTEPGIYFNISHKVDKYIRNKINEDIMKKYCLDIEMKETFLNLIVSTKKNIVKTEVKGADYDKKNNFINWGLWLPYNDIVFSKNQLIPYLKHLFDAIVHVLGNYKVKENDIRKIQKTVETEVINNHEYDFDEEIITPPDLSKLGL